jgi:predicted nucleic acid-binding protein
MMFLLDTNVISELRRRSKIHPQVDAWARSIPAEQLFLSVVTVMEIEQGILLLDRRDGLQAGILRHWLRTQLLPSFEGRILTFDLAAAFQCAALHIPDPKPDRDSMIAATASIHGLTVATRNTKDFAACGVRTFNPWLDTASQA